MPRDELQRLVDELAEDLGRSVVVDDPGIRLICASRHYGDEDPQRVRAVLQREVGSEVVRHILDQGVATWRGPGIVPARDDVGMVRRVVLPLRWQGFLLGVVIVIDARGTMTDADLDRLGRAGGALAACLYRDRVAGDEERAARESSVGDLLGADPSRRRAGADFFRTHAWLHDARPLTVTVFEVSAGTTDPVHIEAALRDALEGVVRRRPVRTAYAVAGDRATLLESWDRVPAASAVRARAAALAGPLCDLFVPRAAVTTGVGEVSSAPDHAWRAYGHACQTIDVLRRLGRNGEVALWEELGVYGLLIQLSEPALDASAVPAPIRRLIAEDRVLLDTLSCFLDAAGSSTRAAQALSVHRTTLYYRLDRIRELTGVDLDDGAERLRLHLGLSLARLVGLVAGTPDSPPASGYAATGTPRGFDKGRTTRGDVSARRGSDLGHGSADSKHRRASRRAARIV